MSSRRRTGKQWRRNQPYRSMYGPTRERRETRSTRTQTTNKQSPSYTPSSGSETQYPKPKAFPQVKSKETADLEHLQIKSKETVDLEQLKIDFEKRREECKRKRTTRKGTNAFVEIERRLTCGKTLKSERKDNMEKEKVKKEPISVEKTDSEVEEEKQDYQEFMEFQKWKASKDKPKKHSSNKA